MTGCHVQASAVSSRTRSRLGEQETDLDQEQASPPPTAQALPPHAADDSDSDESVYEPMSPNTELMVKASYIDPEHPVATGGKKQRTCLGHYDLSAPTPDKKASGRKDDTDGAGGAGSSSEGAGATGSSQAVA